MFALQYRQRRRRSDRAPLIADLATCFTIKVPIYLATMAAIVRRAVLGNLLIALTRGRRPWLMNAFEVVCMQDVPRRADDFLKKAHIVFVWRYEVATSRRRSLLRNSKRA